MNGYRIAAISGATLLSLAVVAAFLYTSTDAQNERLVMLLAFVGPTVAALIAIAKLDRVEAKQVLLDGKVGRLEATVDKAANIVAPAVQDAADRVEHAVEKLPEENG